MKINIILSVFLFASLNGFSGKTVGDKIKSYTPPGTIQVNEQLYCDANELSNKSYLEYLYWIQLMYGRNSATYKAALPKAKIWSKFDPYFTELDKFYAEHPAYFSYPVVGLSREQAENYSKWRSDRVFEGWLIKNKVILFQRNQDSTNFFTIERYYAGEYMGTNVDSSIIWYPNYSLPTIEQWNQVWEFSQSYNAERFKKCQKKKNYGYFDGDSLLVQSLEKATVYEAMKAAYEWRPEVIVPIDCGCCKKQMFMNLAGNVREMSNEEGVAFGGGWVDSLDVIRANNRYAHDNGNPYTGFRNVFTWKKKEF